MSRRAWTYALAALGFYSLFLIATAPAALMAWMLREISNETIQLTSVRGSVWRGTGELIVRGSNNAPISFGEGNWSLNPLWLGVGKIATSLQFQGVHDTKTQFTARVRAGYRSVSLHEVKVTFPAAIIATAYAPAAFVMPGGTVQMAIDDLTVGRKEIDGVAQMEWFDASTNLSTVRPLGHYRLVMRGAGEVVAIKISTVEGDLVFNGEGDWRIAPGLLQLQMTLRPTAREREFEPLLKLFGKDQGDGTRKIIINTRLAHPWG